MDLHEMSVVELRAQLRERSMPTTGKKSELIKRLSVLPLSSVADADETASTVDGEDETPGLVRKTRKSAMKTTTTKKTKKAKVSEPLEEEDFEEALKDLSRSTQKHETVSPADSMKEEEKEGRKKKKKSSTGKKAKKAKVIETVEEEQEVEDPMKEEIEIEQMGEDVHNTSNQTYDIVSPVESTKEEEMEEKEVKKTKKNKKKSKEGKREEVEEEVIRKEEEEEKTTKQPKKTPVRRESECRRSIFKRLGLDPVTLTPTLDFAAKKRDASAASLTTNAIAKRRKSTVVKEEKDEEDTVEKEFEMEDQVPPHEIQPIEEEEEGGVEEEEEEVKRDKLDPQTAEFFSDDEEVAVEMEEEKDQSMLSEVSGKSSRRASLSKSKRLSASAAKASPAAQQPRTGALSTVKKVVPSSSSASIGRMPHGERFARAHAKLFADQEFIGDTVVKKEERKAALLKASATTKRLATPKTASAIRAPLREQMEQKKDGFKFGSTTIPKSFAFGTTAVDHIQNVQKRPSAIPAPTSVISKKKEETKVDAKTRAKVIHRQMDAKSKNPMLLPTIPDDSSFVERMATPRNILNSSSRTHRGAGGYTPKRGKVNTFVDTSKLSDREYQLALDAGLVPGAKKMTSSTMKRDEEEERRIRARDELLNVKRKLKLT